MNRKAALLFAAGCTWLGLVAACAAVAGGTGGGGWTNARVITVVPAVDTYLNTDSISRSMWCDSPTNCTVAYSGARSKVWAVSEVDGSWHTPVPVPGLTGTYFMLDVSCTGPGDCLAGSAGVTGGLQAAQVAAQLNGVWGRGRNVPGLASLSSGGISDVTALSCGAGGWCAVAGEYGSAGGTLYGSAGHPLTPYLTTVHGGTWVKAEQVPGLAALKAKGWTSTISTASCGTGGWCAAGGSYRDRSSGRPVPFVVTGRDGTWGRAHPIGNAADGDTAITAISCTTLGNCSAVGTRATSAGATWPFVVTERNGTWGQPEAVPGISLGRTFVAAAITDLACTAPGDCVLTGFYGATSEDCGGEYNFCYQGNYSATVPFVASQVNGTWLAAREVPGLAALNRGGITLITSVSCDTPGHCAAGGLTTGLGESARIRGFVISESDGAWGQPEQVPGLAALRSVGSEVDFAFCDHDAGPAPECIAIGSYGTARPGSPWKRHLFATGN